MPPLQTSGTGRGRRPGPGEHGAWSPSASWRAGRLLRLASVAVPLALFAATVLLGAAGRMPQWLPLLAGVAATAGMAVQFVLFGRVRGRRRALRQLATEHGWTLASMGAELPVAVGRSGPTQFTHRWSWPPFAGGNQGSVVDLLTGETGGRRFAELTYSYADRGVRAAMIAVSVVGLPAALPRLQVSPEGAASAVLPGLRWFDVDLESEAFNRRYRVQAADRRYAVDVLNPRAVEALLSVEPLTWRIDGSDLVAFGPPADDPAQILRRLRALCTVADRIPAFVFDDHRLGPAVPLPGAGRDRGRRPKRWRGRRR